MDIYRPNHTTVFAAQISRQKLMNGSIRNIDRSKIVVWSDHAIVTTSKENVQAKIGDWIVRHNSGEVFVFSNEMFHFLYSKI